MKTRSIRRIKRIIVGMSIAAIFAILLSNTAIAPHPADWDTLGNPFTGGVGAPPKPLGTVPPGGGAPGADVSIMASGIQGIFLNGGGTPGGLPGGVGIGIGFAGGTGTLPVSTLEVDGDVVVGSGFISATGAPPNGMIVESTVGIGIATPSATTLLHVDNPAPVFSQNTYFEISRIGYTSPVGGPAYSVGIGAYDTIGDPAIQSIHQNFNPLYPEEMYFSTLHINPKNGDVIIGVENNNDVGIGIGSPRGVFDVTHNDLKPPDLVVDNNDGKVGIGTYDARKRLEVHQFDDAQLRLTRTRATDYTDFETLFGGELDIAPSGGKVNIVGSLGVSVMIYDSGNFGGLPGELLQATPLGTIDWVSPNSIADNDWDVTSVSPHMIVHADVTGNVGIGTSGIPDGRLAIYQSAAADIFNLYDTSSSTINVLTVEDGGNVGIGTTPGSYRLNVAGNFYANKVDTGLGTTEVHLMDQDVQRGDPVTFLTVNTGQGNNYLYDMNQNVQTGDAVTFLTVDTGQGANKLYDMDQNLQKTDNVEFNNVHIAGYGYTVGGFHVGGTADPGTDNLKVDGNFDVDGNLIVHAGYAVFNQDGLNNNFRIEGLSDTNVFFVHATNNNIGIGISSPISDTKLHVKSSSIYSGYFESDKDSSSTHVIHAKYTGSNNGAIAVYGDTGNNGFGGYFKGGSYGVYAQAVSTGTGTYIGSYGLANGASSGYNIGIYGSASGSSGSNYAGWFNGAVHVSGTLSKSSGSFKIDHPLDPENKTLSHSFVESPDMMNIYNGNVVLDKNGEAWIELPEWFQALNKDFRYQLSCIGKFAPVYVSEEISDNKFKIAGGKSEMNISWQVTGIRKDPWAEKHRIPIEENKTGNDIGKYLNPEVYGKTKKMGIGYIPDK